MPRERDWDAVLLTQKLRTILHVAVKHGHDSLVLGAFGCGYFANPPDEVADTFADLLFGEFKDAFRVVVFAIPDKDGEILDEFTRNFPKKEVKDLAGMIAQFKRRTTNMSQEEISAMMADDEAYRLKKEEEKKQAAQAEAGGGNGSSRHSTGKQVPLEVEKKTESGVDPKVASRAGAEADSCCKSCTVM